MTIVKQGGHRLFERDQETSRVVSEMLVDLEKNGMDAAKAYSRKFDGWDPPSFELSARNTTSSALAMTRSLNDAWRELLSLTPRSRCSPLPDRNIRWML